MTTEDLENLIKELIERTTVGVSGISVSDENPKNTWFKVAVDDPYLFTARDGEALFALNHLARKIVENKVKDPDSEPQFLIDIGDFQKKRVENVKAVAHLMAERARYFKSNIEVDPMPAFERRIVHEFLADQSDLKTESTGTGPGRRVVIKYVGPI